MYRLLALGIHRASAKQRSSSRSSADEYGCPCRWMASTDRIIRPCRSRHERRLPARSGVTRRNFFGASLTGGKCGREIDRRAIARETTRGKRHVESWDRITDPHFRINNVQCGLKPDRHEFQRLHRGTVLRRLRRSWRYPRRDAACRLRRKPLDWAAVSR